MRVTRTLELDRVRRSSRGIAVIAVTAAMAGLSACGGSDTKTAAGAASPAAEVDVAAASRAIAEYTGKPGAFMVDKPLAKSLKPGTKFVYVQCQTPICALYGQLLKGPVKAIGATMTVVKAPNTAAGVESAAATALSQKPAAVLLPSIASQLLGDSVKKLTNAGIKVTSIGIVNAEKFGIQANVNGDKAILAYGKLMADWAVARNGAKTDAVFYQTPELDFSALLEKGFTEEMAKVCSTCNVRVVPISVTTFGTTAPGRVVSDLQAKPKTNSPVFAVGEAATGLPAALKAAGLDGLSTMGYAATPGNLQDVKDGKLAGILGLDLLTAAWTQVDETARLINGEPLTAGEKRSFVPVQFLAKEDITFDPSKGYTGYPDVAERFAKLWNPAR